MVRFLSLPHATGFVTLLAAIQGTLGQTCVETVLSKVGPVSHSGTMQLTNPSMRGVRLWKDTDSRTEAVFTAQEDSTVKGNTITFSVQGGEPEAPFHCQYTVKTGRTTKTLKSPDSSNRCTIQSYLDVRLIQYRCTL